jgi:hypothetical protein
MTIDPSALAARLNAETSQVIFELWAGLKAALGGGDPPVGLFDGFYLPRALTIGEANAIADLIARPSLITEMGAQLGAASTDAIHTRIYLLASDARLLDTDRAVLGEAAARLLLLDIAMRSLAREAAAIMPPAGQYADFANRVALTLQRLNYLAK